MLGILVPVRKTFLMAVPEKAAYIGLKGKTQISKCIYAVESAELQIRGGLEDNSKIIFFLFLNVAYVVTTHQNLLDETVLMVGHKICSVEKYG